MIDIQKLTKAIADDPRVRQDVAQSLIVEEIVKLLRLFSKNVVFAFTSEAMAAITTGGTLPPTDPTLRLMRGWETLLAAVGMSLLSGASADAVSSEYPEIEIYLERFASKYHPEVLR